MKKKKIIIILLVFFISILLLVLFSFGKSSTNIGTTPLAPTPTAFQTQNNKGPQTSQQETDAQRNYANDRKSILKSKPWLLKLPLTSSDYFISYDTERNQFLVTVYYNIYSTIPREEQIASATNDAKVAIQGLGLQLADISIIYYETEKDVKLAP